MSSLVTPRPPTGGFSTDGAPGVTERASGDAKGAAGGARGDAAATGSFPRRALRGEAPAKDALSLTKHFSPDDIAIVQKRQDWRLRVAEICVEYFDSRPPESLATERRNTDQIAALSRRFARVADYVRQYLPSLLANALAVHELEAVRYSVNYFLEEIVRHLRTSIQRRLKTKHPLERSTREEVRREVRAALGESTESLLVFIEDVVKLAEFEIEVLHQRERIRLLLGSDRQLCDVGSNDAILNASLESVWEAFEKFLSVYGFIKTHLPPLLDKESPYPQLEEELRLEEEQFRILTRERLAPFEKRLLHKRAQDQILRGLQHALEHAWEACNKVLEDRVKPLLRQLELPRPGGINAVVINRLFEEVRDLGEWLAGLPPELLLPHADEPLDERDEIRGDVERLDESLAQLQVDLPALRQAALLGRGEADEIPESPMLEEMLAEVEHELSRLQESLASARHAVEDLRADKVRPLRGHFCAVLGEFRTFLQTGFAHIAAKDPRSTESSYHFFLREFSNEAHQALVLLKEIRELETYINSLVSTFRVADLPLTPKNLGRILRVIFVEKLDEQKRIPSGEGWQVISSFLEKLKDDLVPRLQRVCALDGIRYADKNNLTEWAMELSQHCSLCLAQHEIGYSLLQEMGRLRDEQKIPVSRQTYTHIVTSKTCREMQESLYEICRTLTEIIPYVGIMKGGVEQRASVFFHRQQNIRQGEHAGYLNGEE